MHSHAASLPPTSGINLSFTLLWLAAAVRYSLPRLGRRIEHVLVTDRAVLVFGAEAEAAAIDLADFHEGCRSIPVIPVIMVPGQRVVLQRPLPFAGAARPVRCTPLLLPLLLEYVAGFPAVPGFDPANWAKAAYRPVPGLIDAACRLYARHDVAALLLANSGRGDLARTQAAVGTALAEARAAGSKLVVFVTGAPGAGKTLCGLDLAFAPGSGAVFLTGNPALLHVLRAALVRDAAARGLAARAARQRVEACVQALHHVRDHHLANPGPPAERVWVIDEAQRCWTEAYARRKTQNRESPLLASEPAILLDAMARHDGFAAIVCLLGGGQEIHAGEGGLATWGGALAARPAWRAIAPNPALGAEDPRQLLPPIPRLRFDPALHLGAAVRAWRAPQVVRWVEAMLAGDAAAARALAQDIPVRVTRSLAHMRAALRSARLERPGRVGLVASSAARRLRAEGLGGLLWHQDEDAIASWFLETWPDVRSADALEVAGTEFGVQGLELDHVGVCWDADLVREHGAWVSRAFRATAWTVPRDPEALSNRLNAYRVLLTRARRSTIIWVPRGHAEDPTRAPDRYNAIAAFLDECGALPLVPAAGSVQSEMPEPMLL